MRQPTWDMLLHIVSDPRTVLADASVHSGVSWLGTPNAPRHNARNGPPVGSALLQQERTSAVTLEAKNCTVIDFVFTSV